MIIAQQLCNVQCSSVGANSAVWLLQSLDLCPVDIVERPGLLRQGIVLSTIDVVLVRLAVIVEVDEEVFGSNLRFTRRTLTINVRKQIIELNQQAN